MERQNHSVAEYLIVLHGHYVAGVSNDREYEMGVSSVFRLFTLYVIKANIDQNLGEVMVLYINSTLWRADINQEFEWKHRVACIQLAWCRADGDRE